MSEIDYYVPGMAPEEDGIVAGLRWPVPGGVARVYVEATTDPGDVVLVPYCQGPTVVRDIVGAGRRALALNFDPAVILVVRATLAPLAERQLDAAVARVGDSMKHGVPVRQSLADLYSTTCPACLRPAVADYFLWDREQEAPVAKALRCPACSWEGQTGVDPEDLARLAEVPARGIYYHFVLDRVAPQDGEGGARARLEPLLDLYSARNLYALAELTLKIESLFPEGPVRQALNALLLDCLDRCSSLAPLPDTTVRRRGLVRPGRFVERNVWFAFEEAAARLRPGTGPGVLPLAESWESFWASDAAPLPFVGQRLVRDLERALPPRSMRLILSSPPVLDPAAWLLSSLWGAWVLGTEAVAPLRPLLRQRVADPAWYAEVMAGALHKLSALLCDDGRLVLVLTGQRPVVVEALLLAASRARLGLAALVQCGADYRLVLRPTFPRPPAVSSLAPEAQIRQAAADAAAETIRARGEPTPWRTLHAAVHRRLAEMDLWATVPRAEGESPSQGALEWVTQQIEVALEAPSFVRLEGGDAEQELLWLAGAGHADMAPALCDRVEAAAHQALASEEDPPVTEAGFARAVYARFPGALTPEGTLVAACLRDCGREVVPGRWRLREEDRPHARQAERQAIIGQLLELGERLGYRAEPWAPFDLAWLDGARARAVLLVRWQAAVGEALALTDQVHGATPYLVIPGGRAGLIGYKLAHNPVWQRLVQSAGWQVIKYRHVRELSLQPDVDEYSLQTIIGLDPIVERESVQLALF